MKTLNLKRENLIFLFVQKSKNMINWSLKKHPSYFEKVEKGPEFSLIKNVEWKEIKNLFTEKFAKI